MAIYGHKFKSCFETENEIRLAKREWALSLVGFGEQQLVQAVDYCKETLAWMPTVSEFLAILAEQDDLPGVQQAYREAATYADIPSSHPWSHPAVFHAGCETGWFRLRGEEEASIFPLFSYYYSLAARRFRAGESLRQPSPKPLPDNRQSSLYHFMVHWSEAQQLPREQACALLYYLTKPEGSRVRNLYRERAEQKLKQLGLEVALPDSPDVSSVEPIGHPHLP